ncbi:MAG: hypothetical protein ABIO70_36565 [Pseudomonadota bacterium]
MTPPPAPLAALLFAAACSTQGALQACPDPDCRAAVVQREFATNPVRSAEVLATLAPLEQEVLVRALAQGYPEDLMGLCAALVADSAGRVACEHMQRRPHLRLGTKARDVQPVAARQAPGPATRHPALPQLEPPGEVERAAARVDLGACEGDPSCITGLATAAAAEGWGMRAGAICAEGFSGAATSQQECDFRSAEALADARRWRATDEVVALCSWAGTFAHGCVQHSIVKMFPDLPAADAAGPEDVAESLEAVAALERAVGPALAAEYTDLFWAMWTASSFAHAERVDGRLLQVLPPAAWPHVRMGAAWWFLERYPLEGSADLDVWTAALGARLADPGRAHPAAHHPPEHGKERCFWPDDLDDSPEGTVPAVFCMGPARRPAAQDPGLDLELALLEASGRIEHPPELEFYRTVLESERDILVRWTALRLLGARDPASAWGYDQPGAPALLRLRARQPAVR